MVELKGVEPFTSSVQTRRSSQVSYSPIERLTDLKILNIQSVIEE